MNKQLVLLVLFMLTMYTGFAQRSITYSFEPCVNDSLQNGIQFYVEQYKSSVDKLKFYVLITSDDQGYGVYLQEYSHLPKSGLLDLIVASNRKLIVSKKITLQVLFPPDILSDQIKKEKILALPLAGYYLRVTNVDYKQKVNQVSILF